MSEQGIGTADGYFPDEVAYYVSLREPQSAPITGELNPPKAPRNSVEDIKRDINEEDFGLTDHGMQVQPGRNDEGIINQHPGSLNDPGKWFTRVQAGPGNKDTSKVAPDYLSPGEYDQMNRDKKFQSDLSTFPSYEDLQDRKKDFFSRMDDAWANRYPPEITPNEFDWHSQWSDMHTRRSVDEAIDTHNKYKFVGPSSRDFEAEQRQKQEEMFQMSPRQLRERGISPKSEDNSIPSNARPTAADDQTTWAAFLDSFTNPDSGVPTPEKMLKEGTKDTYGKVVDWLTENLKTPGQEMQNWSTKEKLGYMLSMGMNLMAPGKNTPPSGKMVNLGSRKEPYMREIANENEPSNFKFGDRWPDKNASEATKQAYREFENDLMNEGTHRAHINEIFRKDDAQIAQAIETHSGEIKAQLGNAQAKDRAHYANWTQGRSENPANENTGPLNRNIEKGMVGEPNTWQDSPSYSWRLDSNGRPSVMMYKKLDTIAPDAEAVLGKNGAAVAILDPHLVKEAMSKGEQIQPEQSTQTLFFRNRDIGREFAEEYSQVKGPKSVQERKALEYKYLARDNQAAVDRLKTPDQAKTELSNMEAEKRRSRFRVIEDITSPQKRGPIAANDNMRQNPSQEPQAKNTPTQEQIDAQNAQRAAQRAAEVRRKNDDNYKITKETTRLNVGPGKGVLNDNAAEVERMIATGATPRHIAERYDITPLAVRSWLKRRPESISKMDPAAVVVQGKTYRANSHWEAAEKASKDLGVPFEEIGDPKYPIDKEGFITNKGKFVDRQEAYGIAKKQKQIKEHALSEDLKTMFSEDVRQETFKSPWGYSNESYKNVTPQQHISNLKTRIGQLARDITDFNKRYGKNEPNSARTHLEAFRKELKDMRKKYEK